MVGEVKCLLLYRIIEYTRSKRRWRLICKSGSAMNQDLTSRTVATLIFVVARAASVRALMFGIVCAAIGLGFICCAARFARRFFVELGCVLGIVAAASPRLIRRDGEQAEQEKQGGETKFHIRGKGIEVSGDSVIGIFKTLCQCS